MDVEIKLNFLLAKVKFGQHRRYQEWFQKKVGVVHVWARNQCMNLHVYMFVLCVVMINFKCVDSMCEYICHLSGHG